MTKSEYVLLHIRIRKLLGNPNFCEKCKNPNKKRYDWANIDHKYSENPKDWIRLCRSCHIKHDRKTPEFCKCGKPHYEKGLCSSCYNKKRNQTKKRKQWTKKFQKTKTYKNYMKNYMKNYRKIKKIE